MTRRVISEELFYSFLCENTTTSSGCAKYAKLVLAEHSLTVNGTAILVLSVM